MHDEVGIQRQGRFDSAVWQQEVIKGYQGMLNQQRKGMIVFQLYIGNAHFLSDCWAPTMTEDSYHQI